MNDVRIRLCSKSNRYILHSIGHLSFFLLQRSKWWEEKRTTVWTFDHTPLFSSSSSSCERRAHILQHHHHWWCIELHSRPLCLDDDFILHIDIICLDHRTMSLLFYLIVVFGTVDSNLTSIETSSRLTRTSERSTNICQTCRCSTIPSLVNCSTIFNLDEIHSSPIVWDIVDFSFRQLEFFDDQQILSLRMRHFFLNSNRIRIIADRTFDSLVDVLIVLDLSNNSLVNLSSTLFNEKFLQLKTLNLSRNEIEQFPSDLRQCSSLNRLDFSSNRLKTLPRFALNGLNNLTWLSLADNRDLTCKSISIFH